MHKFKVGQTALATIKSFKFKDEPVKILECRQVEFEDTGLELYYMAACGKFRGQLSVWEHELKEAP